MLLFASPRTSQWETLKGIEGSKCCGVGGFDGLLPCVESVFPLWWYCRDAGGYAQRPTRKKRKAIMIEKTEKLDKLEKLEKLEELEKLTSALQVTNLPGLIERRCQSGGGRLTGRDPVGSRWPTPSQPRVQAGRCDVTHCLSNTPSRAKV